VKELSSDKDDITPQYVQKKGVLMFSSNRDGNYEVYEVPVILDDEQGGYQYKPYLLNHPNRDQPAHKQADAQKY